MKFCTIPGCVNEAVAALVALEPRWEPRHLCLAHLTLVRRFVAELGRLDLAGRTLAEQGEQTVGILTRIGSFIRTELAGGQPAQEA